MNCPVVKYSLYPMSIAFIINFSRTDIKCNEWICRIECYYLMISKELVITIWKS